MESNVFTLNTKPQITHTKKKTRQHRKNKPQLSTYQLDIQLPLLTRFCCSMASITSDFKTTTATASLWMTKQGPGVTLQLQNNWLNQRPLFWLAIYDRLVYGCAPPDANGLAALRPRRRRPRPLDRHAAMRTCSSMTDFPAIHKTYSSVAASDHHQSPPQPPSATSRRLVSAASPNLRLCLAASNKRSFVYACPVGWVRRDPRSRRHSFAWTRKQV